MFHTVHFASNGAFDVSWRRGIRAFLIGAIVFLFGMIFVPQCGVPIYADNAIPLSLALAGVMIFFGYRFK